MSEIRVDTIAEKTTANGVSVDGVSLKDGGATLADNLLFNASGKGVYLGVTTATASNLLDDYEEGTFTPTITSGTATFDNVGYVKVGNLVTVRLSVYGFSDISSSNAFQVTLPFTVKSTTGTTVGSIMSRSVTTLGDGLTAYAQQNWGFFRVYQNNSGGAWGLVLHSDFAGTVPQMFINITYETA